MNETLRDETIRRYTLDAKEGNPVIDSTPRRRPLQYGLRTLLVVVAASGLLFGTIRWLGISEAVSIGIIAGILYVGFIMPTTWLSRTRFIQGCALSPITKSGRFEHALVSLVLTTVILLVVLVGMYGVLILVSQLR